jgi:hypothetical protein
VPRYIEVMVFLLGKNDDLRRFDSKTYISSLKESPQPHKLLEGIRHTINAQYGTTFTSMLRRATQKVQWIALVSTSLFRWNVTRDDKFGDQTIAELESAGILFVEQTNAHTAIVAEYTVVFPLLFLTHLVQNGDSGMAVPMLLQNFNVMLSSDENEQNTLAIFALKCAALTAMGKPITVEALFPSFASRLDWRTEPMSFDCFKVQHAKSQVNMREWNGYLATLKTTGGFLVNARTAKFRDMIIIPKGGERVILIQEKQEEGAKGAALGRSPTGKKRKLLKFDYSRVADEHKKCDVKTIHLFVLVADKRFTGIDELKDNEIVIPGTDQGQAIGPLLALLRLHNHAHRPKLEQKACTSEVSSS